MNTNARKRERYVRSFLIKYSSLLAAASIMCLVARAQRPETSGPVPSGVIPGTIALDVGDTIPEGLWSLPLQVANHPKGRDTVKLNDYRGTLTILDFWATWCVPCLKSLQKLDSLQKRYANELSVIPVTYEDSDKVKPFFAARGWSLPSVVSETRLRAFFPYRSIPHQVWIKDGMVRAITHAEEATEANIIRMLQGDGYALHTKRDIVNYDKSKVLALYADRAGSPVYMSSVVTGHIEGIPASVGRTKTRQNDIVFYTNVSIVKMYQRTLQVPNNRIVVKAGDTSKYAYQSGRDSTSQRFSYQLIAPPNTDRGVLKKRILNDLSDYFQLSVDSQVVWVDCYVIQDNNEVDRSLNAEKESARGFTLTALTSLLNDFVSWSPGLPIYINESRHSSWVAPPPGSLKSMKYNPAQVKKELERWGIILKKEKRPLTMYFIVENDTETHPQSE